MHTAPNRVVGAHAPSSHDEHADAQYPPGDWSDAAIQSSPAAQDVVSLHAPPRALVGGAASGATSITAASTGGAICTVGGGVGEAPEHAAATIAAVNMKQRCTVLK